MRRALGAALALGVLAGAFTLAPGARGEDAAATPDVPPGPAAIRGRVVHPERPDAVGGVDVVLYALPAAGVPGMRHTRSDASGAFAFEGISDAPDTAYLVGARYAEVPYAGERLSFAPGESERAVDVRIADVTADAAPVRVRGVVVRIDRVGGELAVNETVRIENEGRSTVFVPPAERAPDSAPFATRLPPGAQRFGMPLGIVPEGISLAGEELAYFGPFYPGEQELAYSYSIPVVRKAAGPALVSLERRFTTAAERLEILVPARAPAPKTDGAADAEAAPDEPRPGGAPGFAGPEDTSVEGRSYRRFVREGLQPGASVAFELELPAAESRAGALAVGEARLFFELDDAALLAREEYHITVSGDTSVVGTPEAPLLRIPLPPGAERLGFHPDLGLQPDPHGGIAVLGPVPAGESVLELAYRLPAVAGESVLSREFGAAVSLLGVYVADTGLLVDSPRLHRRRPVRGDDRTFVHLEGFEVEAGETIALRFAPLPPRPGVPTAARAVLAFLGAGAAIFFLSAPLRRATAQAEPIVPAESAARRERESLVVAIRDLDHDYETGKVAEEDWRALREELRARAMALLREERDAAGREDAGVSAARTASGACPACSAVPRLEDHFCAQCGAPLAAAPARTHEAHG